MEKSLTSMDLNQLFHESKLTLLSSEGEMTSSDLLIKFNPTYFARINSLFVALKRVQLLRYMKVMN